MLVRMKMSWLVMIAAVLVVGCSKSSTATSTGPASAGPSAAPDEGRKIVCHLDCSGNQAKGYGATEEEARADVRRHVEANCKPEDGQHFIFCEPAE